VTAQRVGGVLVGLAACLGAAVAVFYSFYQRALDCEADSGECSGPGTTLLVIAVVGAVPAVGTLVAGARAGGNTGRWLLATAVAYGLWAVIFEAVSQ
jgi:hypothetical protein